MSTPPPIAHTPPARVAITSFAGLGGWLIAWMVMSWSMYPTWNWWLLGHFTLVPLTVVALRGASLRRVLWLTYLAGLIWWAWGVRFLIPVTSYGHLLLVAIFGLYPMLYVLAVRIIHRRFAPPLVLIVPLIWVGLEYIRGNWIITGYPWFCLGHSQPVTMIQLADTIGVYGVSFVVAMTNGFLLDVLTQPIIRPTPQGGATWSTPVRFSLPLWLLIMVIAIGYGIFRVSETDRIINQAGADDVIRVAVVQTNEEQSNRKNRTELYGDATFEHMLELSGEAMKHKPDLIIWPETMLPFPINDETFQTMAKIHRADKMQYRIKIERFAKNHAVSMIVGAHAYLAWLAVEGNTESYYPDISRRTNAAYHVAATGEIEGRYDKVHRVLMGEYIPRWWPQWVREFTIAYLTPYETDYSLVKGASFAPLPVGVGEAAWPTGAPICFEDVMSYVPRKMVWAADQGKRAALLANLTNDGWFAGSSEPWQHEQVARFRCVENRVPMARAVNTGVSALLDSAGRVVTRVEVDGRSTDVAGAVVGALHRDPRTTVFQRFGDAFGAACFFAAVCLTILALLRRAHERNLV